MKNIPVGTIIDDKYRIVSEPIETGGTAVIYKVHHIDWDMDMSMKIPREDIFCDKNVLHDVLRECELWTDLGANPYINSCYYAREIDGWPVIFSEWTDGQSLDTYMRSDELYSGTNKEIQLRILDIAIQVMYGLKFAHSHNPPVIHGDVKPGNIILTGDNSVKLTDFGLTAAIHGGFTDKFCSPEQKNGETVTINSDIYSWAVTVMAMYSGKILWEDGIEAGVCCDAILGMCRIDPPKDIKSLLKRCFSGNPEGLLSINNICRILIKTYESEEYGYQTYERFYLNKEDQADEIADFFNNRALCCLDNGDTKKAAEYWETALEMVPDHSESMYNYSVHLIEANEINYNNVCSNLRKRKVKNYEQYIEEIQSTYKVTPAGTIDSKTDKIYFSTDGKRILCGTDSVQEYNIFTCLPLREYESIDDALSSGEWVCNAQSPKDKNITVKQSDICMGICRGECCLYDIEFEADRLICSFSPDGKVLAVSDDDGSVHLYKLPEKSCCKPAFNKTASCAELVQYKNEYDRLAAEINKAHANHDKAAMLSALDSMKQIPYLGKSDFYFKTKKRLAMYCKKTSPSILNAKKYNKKISTGVFSPDSKTLAAAEEGTGTVQIISTDTVTYADNINVGQDTIVSSLKFDISGQKIIVFEINSGNSDLSQKILIYNTKTHDTDIQIDFDDELDITICDEPQNNIPDEILNLLPDNMLYRISPDGFAVLAWDEESYLIYRLDYEFDIIKESPFPQPVLSKEKADIYGACDKNAFLFDMLSEEQLKHLKALSEIKLENPSARMSREATKAKEYLDTFGDNAPPHNDPRIRYMIDCSDEEYEDIINECKRESAYWNNKSQCSFMTLYLRTLNADQTPKDKDVTAPETEIKTENIPHVSAKDQRRTELTQMAQRIHDMREALLKTVLGQDHAVHAVAEGLFNAEVLAAADKNKKSPRAIFTFAGPPGVGKTLLAEQAAAHLGIPYKRFDMSEYSGENDFEGLIGFDYTWKNSSPGKLTTFVKDNPHCILLFDEFEKAHKHTIQIFYQLLDAGVVTDRYFETKKIAAENNELRSGDEAKATTALNTDPHISFKDTIIIFTTNAGRSLYDDNMSVTNSAIPTKTLLNALKTEIDPLTNAPYFPSAIISRIATGYPLLFNHLMPHHLVGIIENEYIKCRDLIKNQYNINISADKNVLLALLYSAGGCGDARAISALAANFFRNEFYKLVNYKFDALKNINNVYFKADTKHLPDNISHLFYPPEKAEILIYGSELLINKFKTELTGYIIHGASSVDEAVDAVKKKNINFVIIDISHKSSDGSESATDTYTAKTIMSSMAAKTWYDGKRLFVKLMDIIPEMPVYLLETPQRVIDSELLSGFVRLGARGKITMLSDSDPDELTNRIADISHELYMQNIAAKMAEQHKALTFETAPKYIGSDMLIDMCGFELERVVDADDMNDMLSDAEKPKERFDDVIGAGSAKKELKYFVDYLKDPKKFAAQGHRLPKGVLLYGKPGTGKTMLAKALAGESDVTFIPAAASSFVNEYSGSGPAAVRELFKKARRYAPSIIFIDEVDAVAKQRNGFNNNIENTLNALLIEMDGFSVDPKRPVFVLAATNYEVESGKGGIGVLDEAFVRRFDRQIRIELPNKDERKQLLELLISNIPQHNISEDAIENVAARSLGMSPAVITNIVETARRMAFDSRTPVNDKMLEEAYEQTKYGDKKDWDEKYLLRVARHETGHAIINYLSGNTPEFLTIEARSSHGGYMEYSEEQRKSPLKTRQQLIDKIRVALGGRAAEIVYYGEIDGISTGASGDLDSATNTALSMLTYYGMDDKFGLASINADIAMESADVRKRLNEILEEEMANSIKIIKENKYLSDALVDELLKKNRLTGSEISELLENVRSTVKQ